jgi:glutamyl-tRNA(Gln) amidotransferase subunit E
MDYEELGLKVGLEIHQQLNTKKKLFCPCICELTDKKPPYHVLRNLRPTQSELGKIDRAAFEESRRKLNFIYDAYSHHTCLVESDDEPPHFLNQEALKIGLIIASLMHMQVFDEFHTMRKQVIDGSNTGGFQRTGLIASQGHIDTPYGRVIIENLCLEEDAARRMGQRKGKIEFRLDRLGIPLLEITTDPSMKNPEQVREVAYQIGQILRSTQVKRGLGTIRQDLNISIRDGARVEVKGVQNLDSMTKLVENEVKRQINLIEIKKKLQSRKAQVFEEFYNVRKIFRDTESKIISKAFSSGGVVLTIKLKGFQGLIGSEIQPGRRFGTELAGYAKKMGVAGIFHTDELPAYGISQDEVEAVNQFLEIEKEDAFILVADQEEKSRNALQEVLRRAKTAIIGVPEETRKALEDNNTEYLRPLPTASRMYVETDIPAQAISQNLLKRIKNNLPELPEDKKARIMVENKISDDLATNLVKRDKIDDFEKIKAQTNLDPITIASTLIYTVPDLRRDGCDITRLNNQVFIETFKLIEENKITTAATPMVLRKVCETGSTPKVVSEEYNLLMLSDEDVKKIIEKIVLSNGDIIAERGLSAMGSLMGKVMGHLKGKADGKLVNELLKEEIQKISAKKSKDE